MGTKNSEKTKSISTRELRILEMRSTWVHCPNKNRSLWELSETEGVKQRIEYVARVGKATGSCDEGGWKIETKRTDVGLIFGNGLEIRGVEEKHYNFFKNVEIIKKLVRL